MTLLQLTLAALGLSALQPIAGYPQPMNLTGPAIYTHDPTMVYNAQTDNYYVFRSGGTVSRSPRLQGPWTAFGQYLDNGCSIIDHYGRCKVWAPDVHEVNGTYYLYYSLSSTGSQNSTIGVATSKTMDNGSWTDHGAVFHTVKGDLYNAIDPNMVPLANGSLLLDFGSFWGGIYQFPLGPAGFKPAPNPPSPTHLSHNATGNDSEEGSYLYKPNSSEYYYLFFSSGACCGFEKNPTLPAPGDEYKVMVGRSKGVAGPYVDMNGVQLLNSGGSEVLGSHDNVYAPGGESLFWDPKSNRDVIVYHWLPRNNLSDGNAHLGINYVDFTSGWPVLVE